MSPRKPRLIFASLAALVLLAAGMFLIWDYRKTVQLRRQIGSLSVGTPASQIIAHLGNPDSIQQGSRHDDATGEMVDRYTVWVYCSRFDWDGTRDRWGETSFVPRWLSRLNPAVDDLHDAVVELWIRNGKLEAMETSADETQFVSQPMLSLP